MKSQDGKKRRGDGRVRMKGGVTMRTLEEK
jgi:hypothetical protein